MAATHTVTLYAVIIALFVFALGSLVVWSRRELRMRLLGVGLSVATVPVIWFVFTQLPGKPDDMSVEEFREKYRCTTIIPVDVRQNAPIYLLAKKKHARESEYLVIAWNMRLANSLQKSMRVQKLNRRGSIIYGASACLSQNGKGRPGSQRGRQPGSSGQEQDGGDDFTFYPDPVPPVPEKNYGPLYEGPIEMPERQ
jgi:hypothetical protein